MGQVYTTLYSPAPRVTLGDRIADAHASAYLDIKERPTDTVSSPREGGTCFEIYDDTTKLADQVALTVGSNPKATAGVVKAIELMRTLPEESVVMQDDVRSAVMLLDRVLRLVQRQATFEGQKGQQGEQGQQGQYPCTRYLKMLNSHSTDSPRTCAQYATSLSTLQNQPKSFLPSLPASVRFVLFGPFRPYGQGPPTTQSELASFISELQLLHLMLENTIMLDNHQRICDFHRDMTQVGQQIDDLRREVQAIRADMPDTADLVRARAQV